MRKIGSLVAIATLLFSCGRSKNDVNTIVIATSPMPHLEILEYATPLLADQGYTLKTIVLNDYVTPNQAVASGSADANYFQHQPYMSWYNTEHNTKLVSAAGVHIEPIGIYSHLYTNPATLVDDIAEGSKVILSTSITDQGRLLGMLAEVGLITLKEGVPASDARLDDIVANPKNLDIQAAVAPELLVQVYFNKEAPLVLINSNYALDGGLIPSQDALILESAADNPYVNVIAVNAKNIDEEKIRALILVMQSPEVQNFINTRYAGSVMGVQPSNP